jgi:serine protease AprX
MKKLTLLAAALFILTNISAQIAPDKYYIQFTDKNDSPYSIDHPEEYLSQRAIDRRNDYSIAIDDKDIPVNPQYIQGAQDAGASILNPTKWLNGVTIETSSASVISAIEALPYVLSVSKSVTYTGNEFEEKPFFSAETFSSQAPYADNTYKGVTAYDYGPSLNQISMLRGDEMHELGYQGQGMLIAVLDAGWDNANTLPVFQPLWDNNQIIATHDFVDGGEVTFNKHYHGTMVLSTMGGNYPGEIVGTAPMANYLLLRSEDGGSEYRIEEYNWVSAAEFADSAGADVINSSLGYGDGFTDPSMDHTYSEMDGNTTVITRGGDIAASRGMMVVNSAGNSGTSAWYYITAPADGFQVFAIGAVNWQGDPAGFSGNGPTSDGRIKPNITAQGEGAYFANTDGSFIYGNGTSFSSPIIAGMVACLWQAHPEMNNIELMDAIMESGSSASAPDNKIGWGIPDFIMANNILTIIDNDEASLLSEIKLYPNPFTSNFELAFVSEEKGNAQLAIVDMTGRIVSENSHSIDQGSNTIMINGIENIPAGIYFLRLESGNAVITSKLIKR